jgi:hypothetical protein
MYNIPFIFSRFAAALMLDIGEIICVAQSGADLQQASKLEEFKALSFSKRTAYVKDQGWATMPGETTPENRVATECA